MEDLSELSKAILELDEDRAKVILKKRISEGASINEVIKECNEGINKVGNIFEEKKFFLSDIIMAGEIYKSMIEIINKKYDVFNNSCVDENKVVVIGTVKDDIHNIGKNIVDNFLRSEGFYVVDLGVDVSPSKFIKAIKKYNPKVIGISCLLSSTTPHLKNTIDDIEKAGLRDCVKIIIGGSICDDSIRKYCGADYYAANAIETVKFAKKVYENL